MATSEIELDSPAIKALGARFKLTQVFLRDNGYLNDNPPASSCPKHIRFKYDSDDDDDYIEGNIGEISSNTCIEIAEDSILMDDDLTGKMNALGLPISFQTSKQRCGKIKKKSKAAQHKNQQGHKISADQMQEYCTMSKESLFHADKSYYPSSSLLDQTEVSCSGSDASNENTSNSYGDKLADLPVDKTEPQMEIEMISSSYVVDDDLEQCQKATAVSLTEEVNLEEPELCSSVMQPEDLGSSNTIENVRDENMALDVDDDNANCCGFQHEDVKCYGTSADWSAFWDSFYMRYYFYNAETHESTWDPPPGMDEFHLDDIPCISHESTAEMPGIVLDSAVPMCEDENIDGYVQDPISLVTSSDIDEHTYLEDIETQHMPTLAKRRKTRRNRTKKKSSRDNNENHELQPVEEFYVDLTKYWCQRYLLFSRFDFGVKMDEEGWFSVTPEAIARHQASRCGGDIIIDCFAGVGGNAIQFARVGKHVFAIDIDPNKIDYAHHNATIYEVGDEINFIIGDSLSIGPKLKADTVFLSPPWGGPDYAKVDSYDINMLQPYDGEFLFKTFKAVASMIVMFLPRNVNIVQLVELALSAGSEWSLEVEKNFLNGKFKALTAYFRRCSAQDGSLTS